MSRGLQYTVAYTFAKAIDWWAGTIPQPEYWHLNKGDQANSNPHLLNTSVIYELPFGEGRKFLERLRRAVAYRGRMAGQRVLHRPIRDAVHRDRRTPRRSTPATARTRRPIRSRSREILGGLAPYFDVDRVQAGHRGAIRNGRIQHAARTRRGQPGPEPLPDFLAQAAT